MSNDQIRHFIKLAEDLSDSNATSGYPMLTSLAAGNPEVEQWEDILHTWEYLLAHNDDPHVHAQATAGAERARAMLARLGRV